MMLADDDDFDEDDNSLNESEPRISKQLTRLLRGWCGLIMVVDDDDMVLYCCCQIINLWMIN